MTSATRSAEIKRQKFSHKSGLQGSLQPQFVKCGKAGCRCLRGELHGPYWRRYWREDGRTNSEYVRLANETTTRMEVALWREKHPSVNRLISQMKQQFKLLDQMLGPNWGRLKSQLHQEDR